jgi:hypothetical protein
VTDLLALIALQIAQVAKLAVAVETCRHNVALSASLGTEAQKHRAEFDPAFQVRGASSSRSAIDRRVTSTT